MTWSRLVRSVGVVFLVVVALARPVQADDFEDGRTAYNAEIYAVAFRLFQPLAEQGLHFTAEGQLRLGHAMAVAMVQLQTILAEAGGQDETGPRDPKKAPKLDVPPSEKKPHAHTPAK